MSSFKSKEDQVEDFWKEAVLTTIEAYIKGNPELDRKDKIEAALEVANKLTLEYRAKFNK